MTKRVLIEVSPGPVWRVTVNDEQPIVTSSARDILAEIEARELLNLLGDLTEAIGDLTATADELAAQVNQVAALADEL